MTKKRAAVFLKYLEKDEDYKFYNELLKMF